jgi:DNA-binding response OmpR family regulator
LILIIDKSLANARTYADIFYFMGILSYAVTPSQALNEINNRYTAILLTGVEYSNYDVEFTKTLSLLSLGAPIFAICRDLKEYMAKNSKLDHVVEYFDDRIYSNALVDEIEKVQAQRNLRKLSAYELFGFDLDARKREARYLFNDIRLSKIETMIVRCFIALNPLDISSSDILKYAFKPSKAPEASSVRTHICIINKKFRALTGKTLIEHERGVGYHLRKPMEFVLKIDESEI